MLDRTYREIMQDNGISYDAARMLVRRSGEPVRLQRVWDHYDKIEYMTDSEAVDYLLGVVDNLLEQVPNAAAEFGIKGRTRSRIFNILFRNLGRVVPYDRLEDYAYCDAVEGERPTSNSIKTITSFLRKDLRGNPALSHLRIVALESIGFKMEPTAGNPPATHSHC